MPDHPQPPPTDHQPRLGLALGGGVGRGWAHIGVINALVNAGLKPDVIAGTSIGAVVGGCYAAGQLTALEEWARQLTPVRVMRLMDFRMRQPSMIGGEKLKERLREQLGDTKIEELDMRFAALCTDLLTGHEVWRNRGDLAEAVRASYALPGVFPPVPYRHRLLIDGGLVNPVPVSACRALGADVVIAVSLNTDMLGQVRKRNDSLATVPGYDVLDEAGALFTGPAVNPFTNVAKRLFRSDPNMPSLTNVMFSTLQIVADRMSRARLAADPPDILLAPPLHHIGLVEFHRAEELITIGATAIEERLDDVRRALSDAGQVAGRFS
ncbi:MAG: patatin-like phospholipase family protein [Pseudomonadota bacterium]